MIERMSAKWGECIHGILTGDECSACELGCSDPPCITGYEHIAGESITIRCITHERDI